MKKAARPAICKLRGQGMIASREKERLGVESSKVVRRESLSKPDAVCLSCFNSQQQLRFPFVVYCAHRATLALFVSPHESTTFPCAPAQLEGLIARLGDRTAATEPAIEATPAGEVAAR
jgi:hypothetical protein